MDRAGWAVAQAAAGLGAGYGRRVTVLAGPGNNGGDGYVAARYLHYRGVATEVQYLAEPKTEVARRAAAAAAAAGVPIDFLRPPGRADLVIDAVFGGGFRGGIPAELAAWADFDAPVLAVDIPTGLSPADGTACGGGFRAVATVTFHALKPGHLLGEGPDRCGPVTVADIGLVGGVPELMVVEATDAPRPPRERRAHKWSVGSVLVVGGAAGMVGAAVLAGRAALSFGAGAVGVAGPDPASIQQLAPELLAYSLDSIPDRYQVLVVGPGLGQDHADLVVNLIEQGKPMVIDADGLTALGGRGQDAGAAVRVGPGTVLTPHAGEFARMAPDLPATPRGAAGLAERTGAVVVLKGSPTVVTGGGIPWVVTTGGPELATIGTGDVLAGMIGALLARGVEPLAASRSAAFWHGMAAAELAREGTVIADRLAHHVGRWAW